MHVEHLQGVPGPNMWARVNRETGMVSLAAMMTLQSAGAVIVI